MAIERVPLRVLQIEDSDDDALLVTGALRRAGYDVQTQLVKTPVAMRDALQSERWDVVLADYSLPSFDAPTALAILQQSSQDLPFIIVSGTIDEVQAVTAMRAGAHDFVTKGQLARLVPAIERELREADNRRQVRQVQVQLREQEASFRLLFESNPLPMWVYDSETLAFLEVNNTAVAQYGYSRDEFLQMDITHIRPEEDIAALRANVQGQRTDFRPLERQWRHRLKDGQIIDVEIKSHALTFRGHAAALVVAHNISARTRAEEAIRKSERVLREAESLGHTGSWEHNLIAGEIFNTEENLRLFFGDDRSKGTPFDDYAQAVHPDDREHVLRQHSQLLAEGHPSDIEFRVVWPDGSVHVLFGRATVVRDELGQAIRVYGTNVDITERRQAEAQIHRQLERLAALRAIDLAITSSLDLRLTLSVFLDQVITQLGVDAASVLLLDSTDQMLTHMAGRGFRSSGFQQTRLRLGEGRAGRAALERRIITESGPSQAHQTSMRTGLLGHDDFASYYGVPLIAKGQVLGVLELFHRSRLQPTPEWLQFLEALAGQAAIAIENATLFDGLQRTHQELVVAYDATIEGWSRALDLRDKETEGHSQRVTELTLRLARATEMSEAELVHVRRGALLHDMGKIGIPDRILLKPEALTEDEWVVMRQHPTFAFQLLSPIAHLRQALDIPYCHHEKWDGTGYPRGLRGDQIPLAARLFAVVDVWDALRSDRPYRLAWSAARVLAHIRSLSGSHFEPHAVEVFLKLVGGD